MQHERSAFSNGLKHPISFLVADCDHIFSASVIWSHYHWDHTGNMSLFPPSTELIVGPGFKGSPLLLPGFPENPDSPVCSSDVNGRSLREVDFEDSDLQIGGFAACDFFGDGSFYLLSKAKYFYFYHHSLRITRSRPDVN